MGASSVEERLAVLEEEVARLKTQIPNGMRQKPSWKKVVGVYKDDPLFDEAERLGREWRESFRPDEDGVAPL